MKGCDRYRVEGVSCRVGDRPFVVVNLSVGGLFVASAEPLPKGQGVRLELSLPRRDGIAVVGEVSWINSTDNPRVKDLPPGFGVRILRVAFADKMALLGFLREADPAALRRHP